jgi:beta-N-acetylhexosaminidase
VDSYPGTLSRAIIDGLLRKRLGFDGYVMSDDMQMKAIAEHFGFEDAIVHAVNAGVDLLWICHSAELQNRAIEVIVKAVEGGEVTRERLEKSAQRMDAVVTKFARPATAAADLKQIGTKEHRAVAERIVELAGAAPAIETEDPTEKFIRAQKT